MGLESNLFVSINVVRGGDSLERCFILNRKIMFVCGQTKVNARLLVSLLATVLSVSFAASGCKPQVPEQEPQNSEVKTNPNPLSVLVINDEEFAERLERLWNAQSDSKIRTEVLSEEYFSSDWNQISNYDLVVYPSHDLGELAPFARR